MKSLFKKTSLNDSSQKLPPIPNAQKNESTEDHSISSFFKDLAKKKNVQPVQTKQQEGIMSRKNSNERNMETNRTSAIEKKTDFSRKSSIEKKTDFSRKSSIDRKVELSRSSSFGKKGELSRSSSLGKKGELCRRTSFSSMERKGELSQPVKLSGVKINDQKQNSQCYEVDSKWMDGSKDFGASFGNVELTGDVGNGPLKARKSTLRKTNAASAEKSIESSFLQRSSTKKEMVDSNDSIAVHRNSTLKKDTLKAKLEQQRLELLMNFGSSINSSTPLSKVKLREQVFKEDNSNGFGEDSDNPEINDKAKRNFEIQENDKPKRTMEIQDYEISDSEIQENDIIQPETHRQELYRERWTSAIRMVIRGLKSTIAMSVKPKEMEIIGSVNREIIDAPQNLTGISGIMKNTTISKTDNQKAKIISLLRKPAFYRGPEQMNELDLILKTLPAFSRYSKSFRMKLIEKGFLVDLEPYRVVIRQGGAPLSLYFLLSGKCLSETIVVKNCKGYIRRYPILPGDVFGEFGMSPDEKRGYTVHTTTQSVVFSVSRDIYIQMMKEEVMANKGEQIEVLRSISGFQTLSATVLDSFLSLCHIYRYEPNIPILKVGERDNIIFVLDGQCRANRLVPFIVKNQTQLSAMIPEITGPYIPGTEPGSEESIVYYNMSIGLLGPGSFFPRISLLRHEGLQYRMQKFDLEKIIILVNSILKHKPKDEPRADKTNIASIFNQELRGAADDMEDMIAGVDLSVTTMGKMTCLVISKMDLIKILPEESLRELTGLDAEGLLGFSMSEIQQNYFDKINWKGFRDEVLNNALEKKVTIKRK